MANLLLESAYKHISETRIVGFVSCKTCILIDFLKYVIYFS